MKDIILKNKAKVSEKRELYEKSEIAVRMQLIEPILNILGWSTSDPNVVIPNFRTEENDEPDYTLLQNGKIITYIEAKKLSENLKKHIGQLARYLTNQGIEYGILTDGMKWILFKAFELNTKLLDRIIWTIDFEIDNLSMIEAKLKTISFDNFNNLKEHTKILDALEKSWNKIVNNPNYLKSAIIDLIKNDNEILDNPIESTEIENFVSNKLQEFPQLFISSTKSHYENFDENFNSNKTSKKRINKRDYDQLKDYIIPAIKLIKKGLKHTEVFHQIANKLGVKYQTVSARCTRDLSISTDDFLKLIKSGKIENFLRNKFPNSETNI
jgi:predicted type IV restriction endonuclease